eukprot:5033108-Ditylum_brightwellii.AAC.1
MGWRNLVGTPIRIESLGSHTINIGGIAAIGSIWRRTGMEPCTRIQYTNRGNFTVLKRSISPRTFSSIAEL